MAKYLAINNEEAGASNPAFVSNDNRDLDRAPLLGNPTLVEREANIIGNSHGSDVAYDTASSFSCVTNLANTILGTGMLAMPAAIASVGLLLGSFMIFFSAFASASGLYLLSRAASYTEGRRASFFAVSKITYPSAAIWFDLAIAIKCFGVGISYLIIIGDLMPQVVRASISEHYFGNGYSILSDRRFWITASMIIIVPLAFLKHINSLRHTSQIALIAVVYLIFIVSYNYFGPDFEAPPPDKIHLIRFSTKFFSNLPIFVFAFTCHQNIFAIYNELKDNSQENINNVIFGSIGTSALIYQLIGIGGYLTFGEDVSSNIISEYKSSTFVTIGRMAIVILVVFSYPLQAHPCRESLDKILWTLSSWFHSLSFSASNDSDALLATQNSRHSSSPPPSKPKYIAMTTCILLGSYLIAISVSKLDLVLAFVGSTGSTAISFILPGIFYYKIHKDSPWTKSKLFSAFLAIYGFAIMTVCLTMNILRVISSDSSPPKGTIDIPIDTR